MKPYISTNDISLLSQALHSLALLLELAPKDAFPEVERQYLDEVCNIAHSSAVSGVALDSVLAFISALVRADEQIATHVIPNLVLPLQKGKKADISLMNIAKCIGAVVRCHQGLAAGTIAKFSNTLKVCRSFFASAMQCSSSE